MWGVMILCTKHVNESLHACSLYLETNSLSFICCSYNIIGSFKRWSSGQLSWLSASFWARTGVSRLLGRPLIVSCSVRSTKSINNTPWHGTIKWKSEHFLCRRNVTRLQKFYEYIHTRWKQFEVRGIYLKKGDQLVIFALFGRLKRSYWDAQPM